MKKELEIYIHIPFCVRKCAYCDFLSGPGNKEKMDKYVATLLTEIRGVPKSDVPLSLFDEVTSVFFGGGTPSILEAEKIAEILNVLKENFNVARDAEITIEANPGTVTKEKLETYRSAGVNRISFGLQSTNNEELKLLGRIHTYEEFVESYQLARECGFDNINVDLISAIPRQTVESWEKSLKQIIELEPEHVSAYSLIIEEGTPFSKMYGEGTKGEKELPTEEDERMMYQRTEELLAEAGYHRYEISNYAKNGRECKHNLGYWERKDYLGIGLGAASLINNERFKNTDDIECYINEVQNLFQIREEKVRLTETEQMEEFIFLGLRKMQGISIKQFEMTFGKTLESCYGEKIKKMEQEQLVVRENGFLRLTHKGIDISNYVFAEILN